MKYTTKRLLILPLLGFLAAGCSTSSNLQTSEVDDVYFSSSDKVTYVEPLAADPSAEGEYVTDGSEDITERVSDPESYAQSGRRSSNTPYQYSYYDAPFGNPFYAYGSPFYSPGRYYSRAMMMNPWMDPWYDPFYGPSMASLALYDPFWPRPGLSIGIGLGFGRYYNPWGHGYGYGYGYNPYRYGGGYYDSYYGSNRVIANNRVSYGRRDDRSANTGSSNRNISRNGRNNSVAPGTSRSSNASVEPGYRTRSTRSTASQSNGDATIQPRRRQIADPTGSQSQPQIINAPSNSRTSSEGTQPTRRQRVDYTPTPTRTSESRSRSYEPSPSYTPPTRSSSSSSSGSSSGGSSSGGSRRGRN
ncbi:hypothetical protein ACD591_13570 [Rufibacter glacialis]|uniref:DUF3300 domain-containing protein n=1 Tax=Rufibacter glacialis TaxID=1259555 RepID=A0A5M8Q8C0_9BACT|nr:hypothetical protein [Rufibacter glacialis]KAA6431116.1 hypothetical protein FOE74_18655 [Rufibacter glacialis]GGK84176.1 hypothetical protein GCM10011405_35100 [Rufibacter glacialis]